MTDKSNINISFLLGSGISIKAGMPKTCEITGEIINEIESSDPIARKPNIPPATIQFLAQIIEIINNLKSNCKKANYEEIFYVTNEIYDNLSGERKNIVANALIQNINDKLHLEVECEIALSALVYIKKTVFQKLNKLFEKKDVEYLKWLCDAYEDDSISRLDIFTTNHDYVIEKCLESNIKDKRFNFTDGFEYFEHKNGNLYPLNKKIYEWNPVLYEDIQHNRRFFKLHGSINWYRWNINNSNKQSIGYVKFKEHAKDDCNIIRLATLEYMPEMLIGTLNKILEYTGNIYLLANYHFYRSLCNTEKLIICGYGFSDRGINDHIIDALVFPYSKEIKIIVIDPNAEEKLQEAEGGLRNKWEKLIKSGKMLLIKKKAEEINWEELKNHCEMP